MHSSSKTMNSSHTQRIIFASLLIVLLASLHVSGEEANGNPIDPAVQRQILVKKLEALKEEQEYLLFRKTFQAMDSKYLILDLSVGKGMMLYRNRVLRTFSLEKTNRKQANPKSGLVTMTGKIDGSSKKRMLTFDALVLHAHKKDGFRLKQPGYRIGLRDLAALYYALDIGSKAYIK